MQPTIAQILPALESGGVERGTLEIAEAIVARGYRSIVISSGGKMVQELVRHGSEHFTLAVARKSLSSLTSIPALTRLLLSENIDILHARSRLPAWISRFALKGIPAQGRPVFITTVHGQYSVNFYSKIMLSGDQVIATSNHINQYILDNYPGTDMSKVHVIHRGVSRKSYPFNYVPSRDWLRRWHEENPALSGRYILTLPARLTRLKGHHDFISIIRLLLDKGIPAHGLIVGAVSASKKPYHRELVDAINRSSLETHVTFLGLRDDLREIMSVSDIVMSLSSSPESFGRTTLEALSLGVPVIGYDHGGVGEILGELFPEGMVPPFDINSCTARLASFYQSKPAVRDARHRFTLENMQDKTMEIYDRCIVQKK